MAVRYFIKYFDNVGIEHRLDIYDDNYSGDALQVDGKVTLTYAETENPLEAVRGQGLSVELEANKDLTFNNLWSEEQKTFRVEYKRENVILFNGWLNPEGFFENYVDTNWVVTFDCVDGLGYLSDLSFVDENGFEITGRKKYIEVLALALQRTGLFLDINTDIQIRYDGLSENVDVLDNVYANTDRYVKDDGKTIMSCEDVIRDVLEPFGACLVMYNNEWYIYKPNQLYLNDTATFYSYNYAGLQNSLSTSSLNTDLFIGSNRKGALIHHCNANQQISNKSSIGAYRINYKYGLVQSLYDNKYLISYDGTTIDDWTVVSEENLDYPFEIGVGGVTMLAIQTENDSVENLRTNPILLSDYESLKVTLTYAFQSQSGTAFWYNIYVSDKLITDDTADVYYLNKYGEWSSSYQRLYSQKADWGGGVTRIHNTPSEPPTALTGDIYFYVSIRTPLGSSGLRLYLNSVDVSPNEETNIEDGEFHTFQRLTKPSANVEDVKEVYTGDNPSNIYEGTIYKTDTETPTELWSRKGFTESKPLLRIMGEETLRMSQKPARVFSGDIFGFYKYLSTVTIDGLDGLFTPIEYVYDTKNNIIQSKFRQIYGDEVAELDDDGAYVRTIDYGNAVTPTIKG